MADYKTGTVLQERPFLKEVGKYVEQLMNVSKCSEELRKDRMSKVAPSRMILDYSL